MVKILSERKIVPALFLMKKERPHTELTSLLRSHFIDGAFQHSLNCGDDFPSQFSWERYYLVKLITDWPPIYLYLIFTKLIFELDFGAWFFVYFKLDFYCLCTLQNQVPNRPKFKFKNQVQKSISWNRDFKLRLGAQSVTLWNTLRDPTQLKTTSMRN